MVHPRILLGTQKEKKKKTSEPQKSSWEHRKKKIKNGEPQKSSWERRRRRRMVNPRNLDVNTEEEEKEQ